MNILNRMIAEKLITPPNWLVSNTVYLTQGGSYSYATNNEKSDLDLVGICIPLKGMVFPHSQGHIYGFDFPKPWEQYKQEKFVYCGRETEMTVYSIVRFCYLANQSINCVESLFTSSECISHTSYVGNLLRENRRLFLNKRLARNVISYAHSQIHAAFGKDRTGNRKEMVEKFGADVKSLSHAVRLVYQSEQILRDNDMDLREHKEHVKAVKRGEVDPYDVKKWYAEKEIGLTKLLDESKIELEPQTEKVRCLLLSCLEHHYKDLKDEVNLNVNKHQLAVDEIRNVLDKFGV